VLTGKQIQAIISLLRTAGRDILRIYRLPDFDIKLKDDDSPVTMADLASDSIIKSGLSDITPGIPVFSEETKDIPYSVRSGWNPLWILDPLDGTKEFIARNDEFCISLALISGNAPVTGFILSPVTGETWMAIKGEGAYKIGKDTRIPLPLIAPSGPFRINISRTHHTPPEASWISRFRKDHNAIIEIHGSAVKFCRIAEGISDIYPKFSLIHEWDIAAGHLIIEESGGEIIEPATRKAPIYNKPSYYQPSFIAFGKRFQALKDREAMITTK
jgi:3'(2'), 5'-bisphosphate nucleotidase